jgi:hypothetical protein
MGAADLARKFEASASAVAPTVKDTITEAAQKTKRVYLAGAASAGLTPGKRMSGVGRRGAAWGVGYEFQGSAGADQSVLVKFRGPVHLVNNDTSPHLVEGRAARAVRREQGRQLITALTGTRVRRGRRSSGPQGLSMPWGVRASAKHPGTQGKNFFRPADNFARAEVKRIAGESRRQILLRGGFREGGL